MLYQKQSLFHTAIPHTQQHNNTTPHQATQEQTLLMSHRVIYEARINRIEMPPNPK